MADGAVRERFVVAGAEDQAPKDSSSDRDFEGPSQSLASTYWQSMPSENTAVLALRLQIMALQVSSLQCHAILE
jgi:hypothetical protein